MKDAYFTIVGFHNCHGLKPFNINSIVKLVKDKSNYYDDEAISVEMRYAGKVGYVANSTKTVFRGTMSSGRLYDKFDDNCYAQVKFIGNNSVIAKVLSKKEYKKLKSDSDCDINHF